mmetsp:Transcript_39856/g.95373  ORF Transcript_39856/g.95373 Transcript_39856/m.95373 type:complete len:226 (-) Transcript_39856:365-1042(-)
MQLAQHGVQRLAVGEVFLCTCRALVGQPVRPLDGLGRHGLVVVTLRELLPQRRVGAQRTVNSLEVARQPRAAHPLPLQADGIRSRRQLSRHATSPRVQCRLLLIFASPPLHRRRHALATGGCGEQGDLRRRLGHVEALHAPQVVVVLPTKHRHLALPVPPPRQRAAVRVQIVVVGAAPRVHVVKPDGAVVVLPQPHAPVAVGVAMPTRAERRHLLLLRHRARDAV